MYVRVTYGERHGALDQNSKQPMYVRTYCFTQNLEFLHKICARIKAERPRYAVTIGNPQPPKSSTSLVSGVTSYVNHPENGTCSWYIIFDTLLEPTKLADLA